MSQLLKNCVAIDKKKKEIVEEIMSLPSPSSSDFVPTYTALPQSYAQVVQPRARRLHRNLNFLNLNESEFPPLSHEDTDKNQLQEQALSRNESPLAPQDTEEFPPFDPQATDAYQLKEQDFNHSEFAPLAPQNTETYQLQDQAFSSTMAEYPLLPPPQQESPTTDSPARHETRLRSPFHPHLPEVVDIPSLQEAIANDPHYVYDSIVNIMTDLNRVRADNGSKTNELMTVKENWMDVSQQLLVTQNKLHNTQQQLGTTQQQLGTTQQQAATIQTLLTKTQSALVNKHKELTVAREEHALRRRDWDSRSQKYEELINIQSSKQVLLWKFIERLKNGEQANPDGNPDPVVPPMTGTQLTPVPVQSSSPRSENSNSTITAFMGSPERASFNPAANSFVPGVESPPMGSAPGPSTAGGPVVDVLFLVLALPPRFFGICPMSLCSVSEYRCTIPTCRLQHVCEAYNDENGNGCDNKSCRFVHEYRSCHEEIDGYACRFATVPGGSPRKQAHLEMKAHRNSVLAEEWNARITVAALRNPHNEGKY